jgi:O-antigen ligase
MSFLDRLKILLSNADPALIGAVGIGVLAIMLFISLSRRRIDWVLLIVILSSGLVGSANDIVDALAGLIRWVGIGILIASSFSSRARCYRGSIIYFMCYAALGLIFVLNALDSEIQIQRGLLLVASAIAIPAASGHATSTESSMKVLFREIGFIGSIVSLIAVVQLPGQLEIGARFTGAAKAAPYFAVVLGTLLPFTLWAVWNEERRTLRVFFAITLVLGWICLVLTTQRAGTMGGLIGSIPLLLALTLSQKVRLVAAFGCILVIVFMLAGESIEQKMGFLKTRYDPDAGTSGRETIWDAAYARISKDPLIGHGTGGGDLASYSSFHNAFLEAWYNTGLIGLLCFILAHLRVLYLSAILARRQTAASKQMCWLSFGIILGMLFVSLFESTSAGASTTTVIIFLVIAATMEGKHFQQYQLEKHGLKSAAPSQFNRARLRADTKVTDLANSSKNHS